MTDTSDPGSSISLIPSPTISSPELTAESNPTSPTSSPRRSRQHSPDYVAPAVEQPPLRSTVVMSATGPNSLPIVGSRGAPKKFKGKYDEVKPFMRHYERICAVKQVNLDTEKIENITQYCSREVREFMEGLASYRTGIWATFRENVLNFYDADRDTRRYRLKDLERFAQNTRKAPKIKDLSVWKKYNRGFIRIAGWLQNHNKLDEISTNLYFWKGIPKDFRNKLEASLTAHYPNHDLEQPWPREAIASAAERLLQRNRFDHDRLPSDDESDDEFSDLDIPSSDETDSSDDSSDEDDKKKKKKRKSKKKDKKKKKSKKDDDSDDEEVPVKVSHKKDSKKSKKSDDSSGSKSASTSKSDLEVEELINKLNKMSVSDTDYAGLYLRAVNLNPLVKEILESLNRQKQAPRRADQPPQARSNSQPPPARSGARADMRCYGCGEAGHMTSRCPQIQDYITQGLVARDVTSGRITLKNGNPIQRMPNETIVKAIIRHGQAQSNYITVNHATIQDSETDGYSSDTESDSDADLGYERDAYAAARAAKSTTTRRQDKMEGVPGEAKKEFARKRIRTRGGDENEVPTKPHRAAPKVGPFKPRFGPVEVSIPVPVQTPIDVFRTPVIQIAEPDVVMEDPAIRQPKKVSAPSKDGTRNDKDQNPSDKRQPRKSEIQTNVDPVGILNKVLQTPVTLQIGEVFGISKEMTHHLQDAIRPKKPLTAHVQEITADGNEIPTSLFTRSKGTLIKLRMACNGTPITAIIDTGSQLNIAHVDTWKNILKCPMDITKSIKMNDANGGEGELHGYLSNVPLSCGKILTSANIYVGNKAPFELLLGRPWQRGNFVSIDERLDGTYLLFKDQNLDVRYEILVTPDMSLTNREADIIDYLSKTRSQQAAESHFAQISHDIPKKTSDSDGDTQLREYDSDGDVLNRKSDSDNEYDDLPDLIDIEAEFADSEWESLQNSDQENDTEMQSNSATIPDVSNAPNSWSMERGAETIETFGQPSSTDYWPIRQFLVDEQTRYREMEERYIDMTPPEAGTRPPEPEMRPPERHRARHEDGTSSIPLQASQQDLSEPWSMIKYQKHTADPLNAPTSWEGDPDAKEANQRQDMETLLNSPKPWDFMSFHRALNEAMGSPSSFGDQQLFRMVLDMEAERRQIPRETLPHQTRGVSQSAHLSILPASVAETLPEAGTRPPDPEMRPPEAVTRQIEETRQINNTSAPPRLPELDEMKGIFNLDMFQEHVTELPITPSEKPEPLQITWPGSAWSTADVDYDMTFEEFNALAKPQTQSQTGIEQYRRAQTSPPETRHEPMQKRSRYAPRSSSRLAQNMFVGSIRVQEQESDSENDQGNEDAPSPEAVQLTALQYGHDDRIEIRPRRLRRIPAVRGSLNELFHASAPLARPLARNETPLTQILEQEEAGNADYVPNLQPQQLQRQPVILHAEPTEPTFEQQYWDPHWGWRTQSTSQQTNTAEGSGSRPEMRAGQSHYGPTVGMIYVDAPEGASMPDAGPSDRPAIDPVAGPRIQQNACKRVAPPSQHECDGPEHRPEPERIDRIETHQGQGHPTAFQGDLLKQAIDGLVDIGQQISHIATEIRTVPDPATPYPTTERAPRLRNSGTMRAAAPQPAKQRLHRAAITAPRRILRSTRVSTRGNAAKQREITRTETERSARVRLDSEPGRDNEANREGDARPLTRALRRSRKISSTSRPNSDRKDVPIRPHNRSQRTQADNESDGQRARDRLPNARAVPGNVERKATEPGKRVTRVAYNDTTRIRIPKEVQGSKSASKPRRRKKKSNSPRDADVFSITLPDDASNTSGSGTQPDETTPPRENRTLERVVNSASDPRPQRRKGKKRAEADAQPVEHSESTHREIQAESNVDSGLGEHPDSPSSSQENEYKNKEATKETEHAPMSTPQSPHTPPYRSRGNTPIAEPWQVDVNDERTGLQWPFQPLRIGGQVVPLKAFASDWDLELGWKNHWGSTPFDEKEVRRARRELEMGWNATPKRTVFLSSTQALHIQNQTTSDGEGIIRLVLNNAILTSTDDEDESVLIHSLVQGVLYLKEDIENTHMGVLTFPELIPPPPHPQREAWENRPTEDDELDDGTGNDWKPYAIQRYGKRQGWRAGQHDDKDEEEERPIDNIKVDLRPATPESLPADSSEERPAAPEPGSMADQLATRPEIATDSEVPAQSQTPEIRCDILSLDLSNLEIDC